MNKKNIFLTLLLAMSSSLWCHAGELRMFTIMLDPAGDARETGRTIEDSLERAITIQFAHQLQEAIPLYLPKSKTIITRTPGEELQPFQRANFANRMPVDLYLNINVVYAPDKKPTLYLYQFSLGDLFTTPSHELTMVPYDKAHQKSAYKTTAYGKKIGSFLSRKEYQRIFLTQDLYQLPFAPLIGIQAPALGLEMSIPSKAEWKNFVQPIAQSIAFALES